MKKFPGDKVISSLYNGKKFFKDNLIFEVLGNLEELSCFLGLTKNFIRTKQWKNWLEEIQKDIFLISGELAGAPQKDLKKAIEKLDEKLDLFLKNLPALKHFILPGFSLASAYLDCCRAICRRAERRIVALNRKKKINPKILVYINHLSKFLFFFARLIDKKSGIRN